MGPDLFEYSLVIVPDTSVGRRIKLERQEFGQEFLHGAGMQAKPFVKVAKFRAREAMEETLARWIQRICLVQGSFRLALNNYSGFYPHTVFLRVQDPAPILRIASQLKAVDSFLESCGFPPIKSIQKPHLCIGDHLSEETYLRAINAYAQRTFHESFMVEELQLIRRAFPSDPFKTVGVFRLPPQEVHQH
jgi:2'-5' RNA ligase